MNQSSSVYQGRTSHQEHVDEAIELGVVGKLNSRDVSDLSKKDKSCCNCACTTKTILKIAIPTIFIGAVIFGIGYYGVERAISFLDVKLSAVANDTTVTLTREFGAKFDTALTSLNQTLTNAVGDISSKLTELVTEKFQEMSNITKAAISEKISEAVSELSSTMTTSMEEGFQQLNNTTQTTLNQIAGSLEETIRESLNPTNIP